MSQPSRAMARGRAGPNGPPPFAPAHRAHDRRGSAILLVLAGAAVIAFATMGALAAAVEMWRQEVAERAILEAELAAESAMARRQAAWEVREALGLAAGWQQDTQAPPGTQAHSHLQRGAPGLWVVHGVGERVDAAGNPLARRTRTALLRARPPSLPLDAPVTAAGTISIDAAFTVIRDDTHPPGWWGGCNPSPEPAAVPFALLPGAVVAGSATPPPTIDVAGEVADHVAGILGIGSPPDGNLPLTPTLIHTALAAPHVHHPAALTCQLGEPGTPLPPLGWGDPERPAACERFHPFVRVVGDLVAPTGSGQGVLLIDGDLTVTGPFTWAGLLVVRGRLHVSGTGFNLFGALVLLGDAHHDLGGHSFISWSSCALRAAVLGSASVTPVTGTPWSTLR